MKWVVIFKAENAHNNSASKLEILLKLFQWNAVKISQTKETMVFAVLSMVVGFQYFPFYTSWHFQCYSQISALTFLIKLPYFCFDIFNKVAISSLRNITWCLLLSYFQYRSKDNNSCWKQVPCFPNREFSICIVTDIYHIPPLTSSSIFERKISFITFVLDYNNDILVVWNLEINGYLSIL